MLFQPGVATGAEEAVEVIRVHTWLSTSLAGLIGDEAFNPVPVDDDEITIFFYVHLPHNDKNKARGQLPSQKGDGAIPRRLD
jgi:hypothetical protein